MLSRKIYAWHTIENICTVIAKLPPDEWHSHGSGSGSFWQMVFEVLSVKLVWKTCHILSWLAHFRFHFSLHSHTLRNAHICIRFLENLVEWYFKSSWIIVEMSKIEVTANIILQPYICIIVHWSSCVCTQRSNGICSPCSFHWCLACIFRHQFFRL